MGKKIYQTQLELDKERDPETIARRKALFDQYVLPFANMIYKLCIKYSWDPINVEDNYFEVLINFYRRIETYDSNRPIRTWLHICTKRHVNALEKKRLSYNNNDYDQDIEDYEDELQSDDTRVSSNVMGVENWRSLYNEDIVSLLDELKPCYRDALILQEAGYSLKEIAEIEFKKGSLKALNMETIKSRLRLARQYLKNNLTRDGKRISNKTNVEDVL